MSIANSTKLVTVILDFFISLLVSIAAIFLLKHVLVSIGTQYQLEFFANLSWRDYWGASGIASLYLISTAISLGSKKEKDKRKEFQFTINALSRVLGILAIWGISSALATIFF
jgi:hypothetical protein